jgi:hypothetical protein
MISLGYKPGPIFSTILALVEDEQLEAELCTKEEALSFVQAKFPIN